MHRTPIGVLGASGYAGRELCALIAQHPRMSLAFATANEQRGKTVELNGGRSVTFIATDNAPLGDAELVFSAMPHGASKGWVEKSRAAGAKVVDLSSDLRVGNDGSNIPYGLTELRRESVRVASVVANPGCYATAALLALGPLKHAIDPDGVVVDAKSGMTGAGRSLKAISHAGAVLENVSPYKVGSHQHVPEIAQALGFPVSLTPHLLPVRRGLLATCYVRSTGADLRTLLTEFYAASHVVSVLPEGVAPNLSRVQHTDTAEIGVFDDAFTDRTIVICALDNLGKGAAGQAIQNVNLLFGFSETEGLRLPGVLV